MGLKNRSKWCSDLPEMKHIIYGFLDPRPTKLGEIRYVGKSSSCLARPEGPHSAKCGFWQKHLRKLGLHEEIIVLEELEPGDDIQQRVRDAENFWVTYFRMVGADLTNMTLGGEGGSTVADWTPERRKKVGDPKRGVKRPPFSQEWRDGIGKGVAESRWKHQVICITDGRVFKTQSEAAQAYGLKQGQVSKRCRGLSKTQPKFAFYVDGKMVDRLDENNAGKRKPMSQQRKDKIRVRLSRPVICLNDGLEFLNSKVAAEHYDEDGNSVFRICHGNQKATRSGLRFSFLMVEK
jgi:hypothetical protein